AEIGQIFCGMKPGRGSDDETVLFCQRGLRTTDVALGAAMGAKAREMNIGQRLRFA
ncbi:ornithine cyclodeaminase family protein, partial [Rhizobium leguminosarum]